MSETRTGCAMGRRRRNSIVINPATIGTEPTPANPPQVRQDRWTNWDQLAVGEDFWDTVEEVDERRVGEIREQRQMESLRRVHERRLAKMKIDREKFMSEEPYSFMCKIPDSGQPHATGRNRKCVLHAAEDREIIADNRPEIELLLSQGKPMTGIAREFGVSVNVLRAEVRGWGHERSN